VEEVEEVEEVSWPVRTRSIAIRLSIRLKRKPLGFSECKPMRFFTPYRLRSLTQFLSPCSLSQETSSSLGLREIRYDVGCGTVCVH
jgi:hypothetical protein